MSRKVVVTGGAGFIGSHLVDALVALGRQVVAVDDLSAGKETNVNGGARLAVVNILDATSLQREFAGADTVYHLAAKPRVQLSIEKPMETGLTNINGTMNVLRAAEQTGVRRVVFASSSSVYGNPAVLPAHEGLEPNPLSPYAAHKQVGEVLCRVWGTTYGLETVCLRFFNVYGPRFDPSGPYALVIGKFIGQRLAGEPLTVCGDGEQTRDFTHVSDVVRACIAAGDVRLHGFPVGPVNIGGGNPASINRIAALVGGPVVRVPARTGEPRATHADISRAKALLDWAPHVSVEEGIARLKADMGLQ